MNCLLWHPPGLDLPTPRSQDVPYILMWLLTLDHNNNMGWV